MSKVRIQLGPTPVLSRVYIDGQEVHVSRVWFDSGDANSHDGPRRFWGEHTRVHLDLLPDELLVEADGAEVEQNVVMRRPRRVSLPPADRSLMG